MRFVTRPQVTPAWFAPTAAFDPLDLSPYLGYRASALNALTDGDPIGTHEDATPNNRDATQGTAAAKPTKQTVTNGSKTFSVARHDGTDDWMGLPDLSSLTAAHAFIVVKVTNDPSTTGSGGFWDFGTVVSPRATHYPYTDGTVYDSFGTTARKTTVNPTPSLAAWRIYEVKSVSGEWTSWLDGTQLFTTGTNTAAFNTAPMLGRSPDADPPVTFYYLLGDRAEFWLFDAALSSTDQASMRTYLGGLFDIAV